MAAGYAETLAPAQRKRAAPPNRPFKNKMRTPLCGNLVLVFLGDAAAGEKACCGCTEEQYHWWSRNIGAAG
jgi:hypothetical protein